VKPGLIYFMGLQVNRGTLLEQRINADKFREINPEEFLTEETEFPQHLDLEDCAYYAAHMINPVQLVGSLPNDKGRLLRKL